MVTMAGGGPDRSQEPGASAASLVGVLGAQRHVPFSVTFPRPLARNWIGDREAGVSNPQPGLS